MALSRRRFLTGVTAALATAPFARLLEAPARAATAEGTAHRLVVFFTPNGTIHHQRRPVGSGTGFSFPEGSILAPLTPIKDELIVIDGLDFHNASNHEGGMKAMLTGNGRVGDPGGGTSIDQFVAAAIGGSSRLPSLDLGVQTSAWGGGVQTRMSYGPGAVYVTPDDDPRNVFKRLFGDTSASAEAKLLLRSRRAEVLQLAMQDVSELHARLGAAEQRKLEAHLAALERLDATLHQPEGACEAPLPPDTPLARGDHQHFGTIGKAQMDLLVAALACDATRVASLQWAHTVAPHVLSFIGLSDGHHTLSHAGDGDTRGVAGFAQAEAWFAEQFRYLVERLAEAPDPVGGGRLLDTTLVVWAKEMGDARLHVCQDVPFILAGSAGGRFSTGRYLRYDGEPHNRLLVSILHAMGLSNNAFGDPAHGTGPLEGLA